MDKDVTQASLMLARPRFWRSGRRPNNGVAINVHTKTGRCFRPNNIRAHRACCSLSKAAILNEVIFRPFTTVTGV